MENFKEIHSKNEEQNKCITNLNPIYDQNRDYHPSFNQQPLGCKYPTSPTLEYMQASLTPNYVQSSINNT